MVSISSKNASLNCAVDSVRGNSSLTSAADRLVINVSDVHYATHLVTAQFEVPLEQIFEDIRTKISDMSRL